MAGLQNPFARYGPGGLTSADFMHPVLGFGHGSPFSMTSAQCIKQIQEAERATREKDDPKVELADRELWRKFHSMTTEMVITKSGR